MNGRSRILFVVAATVMMAIGVVLFTPFRTVIASPAAQAVTAARVPVIPHACTRPAAGAVVENPPSLFSRNGVLAVSFSYQTTVDAAGRQLFCFMTPDGLENPTLHVSPGDHLQITLTNNVPSTGGVAMAMSSASDTCGAAAMTATSVNIHYHGTNTSPTCHSDEVIHTLINSGESFKYNLPFPADEPPGLYWYHPHVHGLSEAAVLGGASGAIVVDGLQELQPVVGGLPERFLLVRDQNVAGTPPPGGAVPAWDVTLNNIPISFPALTPAVIQMLPGQRQLWRLGNLCADTILDVQLVFDGVPQSLEVVALDGVPTGSQDGTRRGTPVAATHLRLPPAARAEFIVIAPSTRVATATLQTLAINTGPEGDNDTQRTLADVRLLTPQAARTLTDAGDVLPASQGRPWAQRFEGLGGAAVSARRRLYFSENDTQTQFFITVDGHTPAVFDPNAPPAIVTRQGAVEEWTIENRALESHEFHLHQTHFLVESQDNFAVNGSRPVSTIQRQYVDMIEVPFWDGNPKHPFPSVTVRLDFRGPDVGDFVYHCHILNHEDQGMMAIIRVLPALSPIAGNRPSLPFVK